MVLHFNVSGADRKALVQIIAGELGEKAAYLGMPSAAYQIGDYNISKDGMLSWGDMIDADPAIMDRSNAIVQACVNAGFEPEEWEFYRKQEAAMNEPMDESMNESEPMGLTVEMPREQFSDTQLENLKKLVDGKTALLKEALAVDELPINITEDKVSFPWFSITPSAEECEAYTSLIAAICRMAKEAKRVTLKEKDVTNTKYAFRCFLLRLGFIGDEYKQSRRILMKNLTGSSAFKDGKKGGDEA
jgi:hypothetical protein